MLISAMEKMHVLGVRELSSKCPKNFRCPPPSSSSSISNMRTLGVPLLTHKKTTTRSLRKSQFHSFALSSTSCGTTPMTTASAANTQSRKRLRLIHLQQIRFTNRNSRRPKKANHGRRPCSHARRHAKRGQLKSRGYRTKIFGFW